MRRGRGVPSALSALIFLLSPGPGAYLVFAQQIAAGRAAPGAATPPAPVTLPPSQPELGAMPGLDAAANLPLADGVRAEVALPGPIRTEPLPTAPIPAVAPAIEPIRASEQDDRETLGQSAPLTAAGHRAPAGAQYHAPYGTDFGARQANAAAREAAGIAEEIASADISPASIAEAPADSAHGLGVVLDAVLRRDVARHGGAVHADASAAEPESEEEDSPKEKATLYRYTFKDLTKGLLGTESEDFLKVFQYNELLDLDASGLPTLKHWLGRVNDTLTAAVEKESGMSGRYRIYWLNSLKPEAFIYKHRPPGKPFYRGHVGLSTGLIARMLKPFEKEIDQLTDDELKLLMFGLLGVLAHEMAHPLEDKVVRYEIKEEQDSDRKIFKPVQIDEMATDLLALRVLRKAKLSPVALLRGLQLLFGIKPAREGKVLKRLLFWLLEKHPENKLRLNVIRAVLSHFRIDYGERHEDQSIPFDAPALRAELKRLLKTTQLRPHDRETKSMAELIDEFEELLKENHYIGEHFYATYLSYLEAIQYAAEKGPLSEEDVQRWKAFLKRAIRDYPNNMSSSHWTNDDVGILGAKPSAPDFDEVRKRQKILREMGLFRHPLFREWILEGAKAKPFDVFEFGEFGEYEFLPSVLPMELVAPVYQSALDRLSERPPRERVRLLLEILYGNISGGGPVDLDLRALRMLRKLAQRHKGVSAVVGEAWYQLQRQLHRDYFNGRILRFDRTFPKRKGELLHEYALLYRHFLLGDPKNPRTQSYIWGTLRPEPGEKVNHPLEYLIWDADPASFPHRFKRGYPIYTEPATAFLKEMASSPQWRKATRPRLKLLAERFDKWSDRRGHDEDKDMLKKFLEFLSADDHPLPMSQRFELYEVIKDQLPAVLKVDEKDPAYWKGRVNLIKVLTHRNRDGEVFGGGLQVEAAAQLYRDLGARSPAEFLETVRGLFGPEADPLHELFLLNGSQFLSFLQRLEEQRLSTPVENHEAVRKYVLYEKEGTLAFGLFGLSRESAFRLWKDAKRNGLTGSRFLRKVLSGFAMSKYEKSVKREARLQHLFGGRSHSDRIESDTRDIEKTEVEIQVHPDYVSALKHLEGPLTQDFLALLGPAAKAPRDSPEYARAFSGAMKDILRFYHYVFNPDGVLIPVNLKGIIKYAGLDDLSEQLTALIPESGLESRDAFRLWKEAAAKRANRYTDTLFEKHAQAYLAGLPPKRRLSAIEKILGHGMVFSERIKLGLLRQLLEPRLAELEGQAPNVKDNDLRDLLENNILYYAPRSSRFRDEFLEDIAWRLQLNESQLLNWTEPSKSSNYYAVDAKFLNILSGLNVLLEQASPQEKLQLVAYLRKPSGDLFTAVPSLRKWIQYLANLEEQYAHEWLRSVDLLQTLETFIRDAGEAERHILLELLIGSEATGLWFQGPELKEKLYDMIGLERGTKKREVFDAHLLAVPPYEHSLLFSYLLSLEGEAGDYDLVKIFEMFKAPGVKAAQGAAIFSLFEDEKQARKLLVTKDRAMKPTKIEIYQWLRDYYPKEVFERIKPNFRILGSGSIKVVVLIEFTDGKKAAVWIKRPYVEETIASNIDLAKTWAGHLARRPGFEDNAEDLKYLAGILGQQLGMETDFERELADTMEMQRYYQNAKPVRGWSFGSIQALNQLPQTKNVIHVTPIEGAVRFSELPEEDKRAVAELILGTEFDLLLNQGEFEAERTTGNYLFNPAEHKVYPIDMPQRFKLSRRLFFLPDDRYYLGQLMLAARLPDAKEAAQRALDAFLRLKEDDRPLSTQERAKLLARMEEILQSDAGTEWKMLKLLAAVHRAGLRLPLRFSIGVMKAMMILSKEEFAGHVPAGFIEDSLRAFVRRQALRGAIIQPLQRLLPDAK